MLVNIQIQSAVWNAKKNKYQKLKKKSVCQQLAKKEFQEHIKQVRITSDTPLILFA